MHDLLIAAVCLLLGTLFLIGSRSHRLKGTKALFSRYYAEEKPNFWRWRWQLFASLSRPLVLGIVYKVVGVLLILGGLATGLGYAIPACPESGAYYVASPRGQHIAHRYFYSCGGATVGFTQNVDVDGHTVFSTYGGGSNNATLKWQTEKELHIVYSQGLENVQTYEPQYGEVSISFFEIPGRDAVTVEEINTARKAAGY